MNAAHLLLREATAPYHAKGMPRSALSIYPISSNIHDFSGREQALIPDLEALGSATPSPFVAPPLDSEAALWAGRCGMAAER